MRKVTKIDSSISAIKSKLRVAAYCRVSTDSDAQLESLEAQKAHYKRYITSKSEWEFVGLYYDEGITGTKKDKRPELKHLISDCESGKIDLIVTKSISRFSRNITDCLELVRKLLDLNVSIYFEKENINTGSMDSELFLSILSSMAEEESVSISKNLKWSIKNRFKNGTYKIIYPPYGYEWNGEIMSIITEQAEIVKRIFREYLSGSGTDAIAKRLNTEQVPTKRGNAKWSAGTVRDIIVNEKYTGDVIFQKTYTDSQFNRHSNNGQKDMYYMEDHHEPIISREDYEKANLLLEQHCKEKSLERGSGKYQRRYTFSGKIVCGECGDIFKRRIHDSKGNKYVAWTCKTHISDKNRCSMQYIRDDELTAAFIRMTNKVIYGYKIIFFPLLDFLQKNSGDSSLIRIQELKELLERNTEQRKTLTRLMTKGYIDRIIFSKENNNLLLKAENYRKEIEIINKNVDGDSLMVSKIIKLIHFAENTTTQIDFNASFFENHVKRIIAYSRNEIGFEMKCGLIFKERM